MDDNWKITVQSTDIHKYNSTNLYIEMHLKSSKQTTARGATKLKIDCWTKLFKIINNQRIYNAEEEFSSNIYDIGK